MAGMTGNGRGGVPLGYLGVVASTQDPSPSGPNPKGIVRVPPSGHTMSRCHYVNALTEVQVWVSSYSLRSGDRKWPFSAQHSFGDQPCSTCLWARTHQVDSRILSPPIHHVLSVTGRPLHQE